MTLLIRLSHQVDAILVTEVIPQRVVGIVTGTNGIDIKTFHDLDILKHAFTGDDIAAVRIHLMTVGTLDIYRFAVNQQLGILDLHLTEAHLLSDHLTAVSDCQRIEIRCLCCPLAGVLHLQRHTALSGL